LTKFQQFQTADFDFTLPESLIAQAPAEQRDHSRLLVLLRNPLSIEHRRFRELPDYLEPGDVLLLNDSRVIPARLRGINARTGGEFEVLLLEENAANDWWAMMKPGKRARTGTEILFGQKGKMSPGLRATVIEINDEGHRRLSFDGANVREELWNLGEVPLPPYIHRIAGANEADRQRYQTVYAQAKGSVAAPTAGLHFTEETLQKIRARGVDVNFLTLHVGLGTFAPVKSQSISQHKMHEERYSLGAAAANAITRAKCAGKRVVAVGTTSVRVLESVAAKNEGHIIADSGKTNIFIYPPYDFKVVDALLTNFHLPRSTLLMLVSAFAAPSQTKGREAILQAYAEAIREQYRFFSYGDAMLLL
jgi:S-adenosylmethionine:tRNA ribosyltransferase-isomerase